MTLLGVVLIIGAGVLWFIHRHQAHRAFSVKSARPITVADMEATASAVASEIGGGDWRDYVKLWGSITTDTPLTSELKQQPCVSYSLSVVREYEETVQIREESGTVKTQTQRGSETLSSHQQSTPFYLKDNTGQVLIEPEGANIDTVEVLNQFQPGDPIGGMLSFGNFSLTLGFSPNSQRRTLGYRYRESLLPINRSALVVGMVSDQNGQLTVSKPTQSNKPFLISLKNDEALTGDAERNAKHLFYALVGCGLAGVVFLILGLVS